MLYIKHYLTAANLERFVLHFFVSSRDWYVFVLNVNSRLESCEHQETQEG